MNSSQLLFSLYGFLPEFLLIATFVAGAIAAHRQAFSERLPAVLAVGYAVAGVLVLLVQLPLADNAFKAEWLFKGPDQPLGYGMVMIDPMVVVAKLTLLLPLLGAELSRWWAGAAGQQFPASIFHCSGLLGLWLVVGSDDLLTLVAGLELVGLSAWRMLQQTGGNSRRAVLLSAAATPAMLVGIGLIASFTGATNYATINTITTAQNSAPIPVLPFAGGSLLLLVGIALRGGLFPSFTAAPNLPDSAPLTVRIFLALLAPTGVMVGVMRLLGRAWPTQLPELQWQPFVGGLTVMVMLLATVAMLRHVRLHQVLVHSITVSVAFLFLPILPLSGGVGGGGHNVVEMLIGVITSALALLLLLSPNGNAAPPRTIADLQGIGRGEGMDAHLLFAGFMLLAGLPWGILFRTRPFLLIELAEQGYYWIAAMGALAMLGMWAVAVRIAILGYRNRQSPGGSQPPQAPSLAPSVTPPSVGISINRGRLVAAAVLLLANVVSAIPPVFDSLRLWLHSWFGSVAGGW
ncbi:MAG: hypothetical protein DYG96_04895 [Chlorobi bacterium CHB2]|nr:hypothetical protein [Chlorobi bacterium CHB2]